MKALSAIAVRFLPGPSPARAVAPAPVLALTYSGLLVMDVVLDHLNHDSKCVLTSFLA